MSELTQRFGRREEYTRGMSEMEWIESLYNDCKKANEGKFLSTQTPVLDYRLAEQFTNLLEQDTNDYIRRLAAQGLRRSKTKAKPWAVLSRIHTVKSGRTASYQMKSSVKSTT